jgi:GH15 family glucan-1,4-alpha-glucosidase
VMNLDGFDDNHLMGVLEDFIDRRGLTTTLNILSKVCLLKADHISNNWQDYGLAAQWKGASDRINESTTGEPS